MGGRVFIAAGHHPERPGAGFEGFYEHDEAERWLDEMFTLDPEQRTLVRVPTGALEKKCNFINYRCKVTDVAIELHFNSAVNADGEHVGAGCESLFMPGSPSSERLAKVCQDVLGPMLPPSRGLLAGWYRQDEKRGAYFFLQRTRCAAAILEPEFVHRRDVIQSKRPIVARALARALGAYVGVEL